MMTKYLGFVAVWALLFSCAEIERDNQYDMRASNYIEKSSAEGSSSSVAPSSSSVEPSSSSVEPSSSSGAESSSSTAPSSSSVEPSSSSALPSSSSGAESSSSSSSSYGVLCAGFVEGTIRENHYGKDKKQFCDERDGKKYVYVVIDDIDEDGTAQTWMAENLNYAASGSKCGFNENSTYLSDNNTPVCDTYGRLYDWPTALTVCPSGWHLPSDSEWDVLVNYAGGSSEAGGKLKAKSGWEDKWAWDRNGNGTDNYGFSALPGGSAHTPESRPDGYFTGAGGDNSGGGTWWSASEYDSDDAYIWKVKYNNSELDWYHYSKSDWISVRCVHD